MIGDKPQKIIPPSGNVAAEFMQKLFFQTEQRIIAEITRKRNQGFVDYSEHATLRRVQQILRDMVDDSEKYVPQMMAYPFMTGKGTFKGYGSAEEIIQRTDAETRRLIEQLSDNLLGEITEAAATAYQSSADLITAQNALKAAENGKTLIGRHSPDIYRKNVLTGVLTTTATGAGPLTSVEAVARSIEKEGIPAFIDRAGRKWSLRDYGNMATRTTFRQAQTAAELTKDDHDLYEVLRHPAPCRVCAIYSGRVYSKSGTNPNYPSLAQAFGKVDAAGPDVLSNTYLNIHPNYLCVLTRYTEQGKTPEQVQRMRDKSSFEKNPPKGDPRTKKEIAAYRQKEKNRRELRADIKQWEKMREALGDKVPATFATFQKHKKLNDDKYKSWLAMMNGQPKPPKTPAAPKAPKTPDAPKAPKAPKTPTKPATPTAPKTPPAPPKPTGPMFEALNVNKIERKEITWHSKPKPTNDIIANLGGADKTKGSCSSLAFAFIGNEAGGDVLDFRGGISCNFFSRFVNIKKVLDFDGVKGEFIKHSNDFVSAHELLKKTVKDKVYYFVTGRHAAVIRNTGTGIEYLELQSGFNNGFHPLDDAILKRRFGCRKTHTVMGQKVESGSLIIDADSLKDNADFREMLCYINTNKDSQMKGAGGGVK